MMNEILLALFAMIVLWSVMYWIIKKRHEGTYTEVLITYPFDSLEEGKTVMFKSNEELNIGDYVLIYLPNYEMIWKVEEIYDGVKLKLVNRNNEVLLGFPKCYIRGKMIGYKTC